MIGNAGRERTESWLRGPDLNRRPSGYEPDELPSCSTPRQLCASILTIVFACNN